MGNVIDRKNNLCGRTNELAHALLTNLFSCKSFMASKTKLDGTTLHYLAVPQAIVSVHRPIHSKITPTCSLTWQTDRWTPQKMASKTLLNAKASMLKNYPNELLSKHGYMYCQLCNYIVDHMTSTVDHMTSIVDHMTSTVDHMTSIVDHMTSTVDHMTSIVDHMTSIVDHMTSTVDHMTSTVDHMTSIVDHMTSTVDHMTSTVDHMTSTVDHMTSIVPKYGYMYCQLCNYVREHINNPPIVN